MKIYGKRLLALCLVAAFALLPMRVAAEGLPTLSSWAASYVHAAIAENLVPERLQSDFARAITRAEFCSLVVALYESRMGTIQGREAFTDTSDTNVERAAYIGVVLGVGDGRFNPAATLTREQAAVMLARLAVSMSDENPFHRRMPLTFADAGDMSSWAVESVEAVVSVSVMSGVGDNRFAPRQPYTREQSIATIMRLLDFALDRSPSPQRPDASAGADSIVGQVTLLAGDFVYEPGVHFLHGAGYDAGMGGLMSVSGIPFEFWLAQNYDALQTIRGGHLQIVLSGEFGRVVTPEHQESAYHAGASLVGLLAEGFSDGVADVSFLSESGTFLVYVDVHWSDGGNEFTLLRYVFKIAGG